MKSKTTKNPHSKMSRKNNLLENVSWKFAERITAQLISLVVSIILARLLDPADYGVIAIVEIFITIANVFVSDGFGSALIQKKDADELDFYSVLYFNVVFSIALYFILFFAAPFITSFFGNSYNGLTLVIRVLSIRIVISAINSVQHAYVSKHMIFRLFFWATLFGTLVSAVVGIAMAYLGFGVWALVAQYLTNTTIDTIVLQIVLKKKVRFVFSKERLKRLVGFGARILGTNLLIVGYQEIRAFIIGKVYSSADLAYYNKGKQFPSLIVNNINTSIGAVLFPQLSKYQDDKKEIKELMRKSICISSYLLFPMLLGFAAVSEQFVILILTSKWLPCVPLLQLLCINSMWMPIHTTNMQAIKAIGRSDISLKLEIIKKVIELIVLILVMKRGVSAIVWGMVACSTSFMFINAIPNSKLINYSFAEQLKDIIPNLLMSSIMAGIVFSISIIKLPSIFLLFLQISLGFVIYLTLSIISKNREFKYLAALLRSIILRNRF